MSCHNWNCRESLFDVGLPRNFAQTAFTAYIGDGEKENNIKKKIMAENDDFFCWLPPRASIEGYSSLHYIFIHFNYYHNLHKNIYLTRLCFIRMLRM